MIKKTIIFSLIISILTLLNACAPSQAAYENGTGSDKTLMPDTSALQMQAAEATETAEPDETAEKTGTSHAASSNIKEALLDEIIKTDVSYLKYDPDIFEGDYNGDGKLEYFYVFTEKGISEKYTIGCSADIWFGDENGAKRVAEWQDIQPDTYGSLELAGKYYFRYDLAFVTESQTILLGLKDGNSIESYNCRGFAEFSDKTDDFTATDSTYDMVYLKSDDLTCGHTWKKYFYYVDAEGFHEYGAEKITRKEFLQYPGADKILDEIGKKFAKEGVSLSYGFLRRCNGLLHINVNSETKDDITHYYITYKIADDGTPVEVESGDGYYVPANIKDIAVYK